MQSILPCYHAYHYFPGRGGGGRGGGGGGLMADPTPSRPSLVQTTIEIQSPYKGWKLYFPDEGKQLTVVDYPVFKFHQLMTISVFFLHQWTIW